MRDGGREKEEEFLTTHSYETAFFSTLRRIQVTFFEGICSNSNLSCRSECAPSTFFYSHTLLLQPLSEVAWDEPRPVHLVRTVSDLSLTYGSSQTLGSFFLHHDGGWMMVVLDGRCLLRHKGTTVTTV